MIPMTSNSASAAESSVNTSPLPRVYREEALQMFGYRVIQGTIARDRTQSHLAISLP